MDTTGPIGAENATATNGKPRTDADWMAGMVEADRLWREQRDREAGLLPENKAALFEALAAEGVCRIVVAFDGCGDSGQIEQVDAFGTVAKPLDLPAGTVAFKSIEFGTAEPTMKNMPVRDALETLFYGLLEQTHDGWENNDGAYGEFALDVAAGSITLEYNERYTATDYHVHEF